MVNEYYIMEKTSTYIGTSTKSSFLIYLSLSSLTFAGHFWFHCLSVFQLYLTNPPYNISATAFGILISALLLPHSLSGLVSGLLFDFGKGSLLILLILQFSGMFIFLYGLYIKIFLICVLGNLLCGIAFGCMVVFQRTLVSQQPVEKNNSKFAYSLTISVTCFAKALGTGLVGASIYIFTVEKAVLVLFILILISMSLSMIGIYIYIYICKNIISDNIYGRDVLLFNRHIDHINQISKYKNASQNISFWILLLLHSTLLVGLHTFTLFMGLRLKLISIEYANKIILIFYIITALSTPISGKIIDNIGGGIYLCFISSIICMLSIILIIYHIEKYNIIFILIIFILPITEGIISTLLMAWTPECVPEKTEGCAFGVTELLYGGAAVIVNTIYGRLLDGHNNTGALFLLFILFFFGCILSIILYKNNNKLNLGLYNIDNCSTPSTCTSLSNDSPYYIEGQRYSPNLNGQRYSPNLGTPFCLQI
eukprot:GHVL01015695.1.p1 GENE.GHVL01015695.1~~GHVL01015695.1.p1  ORF type:complete len:481 (+),score=97.96 GHVL01015695.1:29-1471(+)